jgi:hypothetical protein
VELPRIDPPEPADPTSVKVSRVTRLGHSAWTDRRDDPSAEAASSLERGDVLFFPRLSFVIEADELCVFSPDVISGAKNVSFDPFTGRLGGAAVDSASAARLRSLLSRFSARSAQFVGGLVPTYRQRIELGRASFRPVEIAGRATSWRKDDTRLHVDAFPATPVHGRRILRLFSNVNPERRPRTWRIGEDFESVARRFAASLRPPLPGTATLRRLLRLTKTARTTYDALMLQLHDRMKADVEYQALAPQTRFDFDAGTTWLAFTDQVSHAAMAGQYQLEQTFLLPVVAMNDERRSPLRILEGIVGRSLA